MDFITARLDVCVFNCGRWYDATPRHRQRGPETANWYFAGALQLHTNRGKWLAIRLFGVAQHASWSD